MGNTIFDKLAEKYPFITLCSYANAEYVGIIQNRDDSVTTIYDFGSVVDQQDKMLFLELANQWWWKAIDPSPSTYSFVKIGTNLDLLCAHFPTKILKFYTVQCVV